jgi:radical SAM superfamily enzyme
MAILEKYDIPVVVHLIIGLPGEDIENVKKTIEFIKKFRLFGIKIHSMYVMEGTTLADMYRRGAYTPISQDDYVEQAAYVLKNIPKSWVVHRLTGDCPKDLLVAPEWNLRKNETIDKIVKKLGEM